MHLSPVIFQPVTILSVALVWAGEPVIHVYILQRTKKKISFNQISMLTYLYDFALYNDIAHSVEKIQTDVAQSSLFVPGKTKHTS